jgi:hypothetical protein
MAAATCSSAQKTGIFTICSGSAAFQSNADSSRIFFTIATTVRPRKVTRRYNPQLRRTLPASERFYAN